MNINSEVAESASLSTHEALVPHSPNLREAKST